MGISLGTVRVYWKRIRMKVGGTRSEVIAELARTSLKLDFDGERGKVEQLERDLERSLQRERGLRVFEEAFEILPTPAAILDAPAGVIVHANVAFANLHGYEPEELEEFALAELVAPEEAAALAKQVAKAAKNGKLVETESTRRHKDGTTFASRLALAGGLGDALVLALAR